MPRQRSQPPSLRRHKPSGLGVVTLNGHDQYLGPWPESLKKPPPAVQAAYDRLIAEWLANGRQLPGEADADPAAGPTVSAVIDSFWKHAEQHYRRPDGTTTNELSDYRYSLRPLRHLYGSLPAAEFSPLKLKAVRQLMVDGYDHPKYGTQAALSRGVVNQRVGRIVRMYKWAVAEELVSETVYRALRAVPGLQRGRCEARETEPIEPVAEAVVDATLPFLLPTVRAMVEVQLLTGMRPGEVCALRACAINMTGPVWLYRSQQHKTAHRGKQRVIAIGPRTQEVIKPYLTLDTQAYLFSPRRAMEAKWAAQRAARRTKVQPSQVCRKKAKHLAGERYTTDSYGWAVKRAWARAFLPPPPLGPKAGESRRDWLARLTGEEQDALKRWQKEHAWHPNQLRHTHGTEVRRRYGLEAAQVVLGHAQANVTQVYAERDMSLAAKVAAEIG